MATYAQIAKGLEKPGENSYSYIQEMVEKPTWKEILLDLIDSNKIDPWNIDLVDISNAFLEKIKQMEKMDLGVQANVILAASILLKYKSNYLSFLQQSELSEYMEEEEVPLDLPPVDELPQLTLSSRIPPKRQITIDELVSEMERIIHYENREETVRKPRGSIQSSVDFELIEQDIESKMEDVLGRIKQKTDETGWSRFSMIAPPDDPVETVYALLSVLHLTQTKDVEILQEEMFGEIFIKLMKKE
jgi:segregation and condensation protein A